MTQCQSDIPGKLDRLTQIIRALDPDAKRVVRLRGRLSAAKVTQVVDDLGPLDYVITDHPRVVRHLVWCAQQDDHHDVCMTIINGAAALSWRAE
jgi:hypothetical protein